jgi:hypothetical protein
MVEMGMVVGALVSAGEVGVCGAVAGGAPTAGVEVGEFIASGEVIG